MSSPRNPLSQYGMPLILLVTLLLILWQALNGQQQPEYSNTLTNKPLPEFNLPNIFNTTEPLTNKDLLGHVSLVNIWATWCSACRLEHPLLMKIKNNYSIPIYGILFDDLPNNAKAWLKQSGNPYTQTALDAGKNLSNHLGTYGIPETFVIDSLGVIRYRLTGAMTEESWEKEILPVINAYQPVKKLLIK
jgi:cytochrome c biogenesis protein CcmG/thiol:disulfide interchange protein DsbE